MFVALVIPSLMLMVLAVAVTRAVERAMPETVPGLILTGIISAILLWIISGAMFGWMYVIREAQVSPYLGTGSGLRHLATIGAKAALLWLPLMLITVVTAPRRWKTNTW